jgi:hypothetical protein
VGRIGFVGRKEETSVWRVRQINGGGNDEKHDVGAEFV